MRTIPNETGRRNPRRVLLFAAAALAVWVVLLWKVPVHFMFDDDEALAQLLSGARSGTPRLYDVYNSPLLSAPVSLLYRLLPGIAWYPLLLLLVTVFSCVRCCVLLLPEDRRSPAVGIAAGAALAACAFLPSALFLQYSVAGAAAGSAVCLLTMDAILRGRGHTAGILAFGFFAVCLRTETALAVAAMLAAGVLAALIAGREGRDARPAFRAGRVLLPAALLAVLFLVSAGVGWLAANSAEWKEYTAFNRVRTSFLDYPHPDWEETGAYGDAGWDETLFDMAEDWFFLDPRIDTEALTVIREETGWRERLDTDVARSFRRMVTTDHQVRDLFLLLVGLTGAGALLFLLAGRWRSAFACLLPAAAFLGGAAFLCLIGRHPAHAFYTIAVPAAAMETFLFVRAARLPGKRWISLSLTLAALLAAAILAANSAVHSVLAARGRETLLREERSAAIDAYALEHPGRIVLTDLSVTGAGAPFRAGERPLNRFFWGGWYYGTPAWRDQLARNGLEELAPELLLTGRVLLVTAPDREPEKLLDYLTARFSGVRAECVEETGLFDVYSFAAERNES